jgi:hypothetical protein
MTVHVLGGLSAHHQEFLAVHQHWYNLCSLVTECYQVQDDPWRQAAKKIAKACNAPAIRTMA